MKIASWNVNSLNVRLPHLLDWLKSATPDIVALQETKMEDAKFPADKIREAGYHVVFAGQKTYNGVALLSRGIEPHDVQIGIPGFDDPQQRVIAATYGDVRVIDVYVVNGQDLGTEKYEYKMRWLAALKEWIAAERERYPNTIVLGDFNIAPTDADVHDPKVWNESSILTSTAEREALNSLLALGFHDSFRLFDQEPEQFSWWDYRAAGFRRNLGLRIDLVLASDALKSRVTAAGIDREPRTWDRPSDHTPVWLTLSDA